MKYKLSELLEMVIDHRGKTPKKLGGDFSDFGIPVLSAKIVKTGKLVNTENIRFISEELYRKWMKVELQKDDIILTSEAPLGEVYVIPDNKKYVLGQRLFGLRVKDSLVKSGFLSAWLSSGLGQSALNSKATGSTVLGIKQSELLKIEIEVPDLATQELIASIQDSIIGKITLNTQTNQTLEQIAQAIFKSWFVDFEPVKAKMQGGNLAAMEAISGKNSEELHRLQTENPTEYQKLWAIADAFPDEIGDDGVPVGWEYRSFGDLLTHTIGGDWGKDEIDEKHTIPVFILRGTDLPEVYQGNDKSVPLRFVDPKKLKNRKLQVRDIVIEVSGGSKTQPTGRSLLITKEILERFEHPIEPASFCRLFRPINNDIATLLGLHLQIIYKEGKTWEYQNQSTGIANFQTSFFLENEKVLLPNNDVLVNFSKIVNPMFSRITSSENRFLETLRDELLPKLLNGEI